MLARIRGDLIDDNEAPRRGDRQQRRRNGAVVVADILSRKNANEGYDARTSEYQDLIKAGVVDPAKVTRVALQNAAWVAGLLLTAEALITDLKDDDTPPVAGAVF